MYIDSPIAWAKGKYLCQPSSVIPEKPKGARTWFWFGDYAEYNPGYCMGYFSAEKIQ